MADKSVVVVTGGGAGIGKACATRFSREGWAVAILDRSRDDGEATADALAAAGGEVLCHVGDVSDESEIQAAARAAIDRWGRIDALVANAGARVYGGLLEASEADWELILGVNLKGVAYSCKAVLPAMIEARRGAIVIISSANALVGRASMPLYDATKAAVLALMRSLAVAHGRDGVRVNAICPGFTMTDFHERAAAGRGISPQALRQSNEGYGLLGRPAEPSEIASVAWFLCGDDAAQVTGQALLVDAGMSVTSRAAS
jgi:meso-butanediol dehydrogenase/(S,S)-butanediol dehydrogenase/diacetyl reductase